MLFTAAAASLVLLAPVFGAPTTLHAVQKYAGTAIKDNYVVTFKNGADKTDTVASLGSAVKANWELVNGFAGKFDTETLNSLRANPDVASIHEDGVVSIFDTVTQNNAPWGLSRLSQDSALSSTSVSALTYPYTYDSTAGAGVDIYIVDTGILTTHTQFGGRAKWGATFGGYKDADGAGHGTHVSGTAAGAQFGVAKAANLIAVKVLSDGGSGAWSDVISGLNYVQASAAASGRPSIASLSLGGDATDTVDAAVAALTASGVHIAVAAGNSAEDAGATSPARAPSAITVGASTITDSIASFSNYGAVVDVFAPGVSVISSWIGTSNNATNSISGTSMATPHVAGLAAYLIGKNGNSSPAELADTIKSLAVKGALTGIPTGTVNYLASNDI